MFYFFYYTAIDFKSKMWYETTCFLLSPTKSIDLDLDVYNIKLLLWIQKCVVTYGYKVMGTLILTNCVLIMKGQHCQSCS